MKIGKLKVWGIRGISGGFLILLGFIGSYIANNIDSIINFFINL